jgi:LuxR family maltose regulon positive regulatory protein
VRYLVAEGRLEDAGRLLQAMDELARSSGRNSRLIVALMWQAIVERALGNGDSALAHLREAVVLAAAGDFTRLFLDAGHPALPELLTQVRPAAPAFVDALLEALRAARTAVDSNRGGASPNKLLPEPLTPRELEVLRLLAEGRTYRQTAAELIIAMGTVQAHCSSIYGKLGASNRTEALTRARELHLL